MIKSRVCLTIYHARMAETVTTGRQILKSEVRVPCLPWGGNATLVVQRTQRDIQQALTDSTKILTTNIQQRKRLS